LCNTDGWGNKLPPLAGQVVTIFARNLDSFIVTQNLSFIFQFRDFGSGQIRTTVTILSVAGTGPPERLTHPNRLRPGGSHSVGRACTPAAHCVRAGRGVILRGVHPQGGAQDFHAFSTKVAMACIAG